MALTTKWATSLFVSASPGVAYDTEHKWLRLNNQGQPLFELIRARILQRLMDLCDTLGLPCSLSSFWTQSAPSVFCTIGDQLPTGCPSGGPPIPTFDPAQAQKQLTEAIESLPKLNEFFEKQARLKGTDVRTLVRLMIRGMVSQMLGSTPVAVP